MTEQTRRRLPRAEREALMLDAAEEVFGTLGFRAASMDDIAQRSGITKALLYEYFGSKEALHDACMERVRGQLFDSLEAALADVDAVDARMRVFIEHYFDFLDSRRESRWLLYGETGADIADAMRELNAEAIGRMLEADPRVASLSELDRGVIAHALTGAGEQVGRWWLARPEITKQVAVERFDRIARAIVLAGLR
jgi:AcrR family transcriptional regulator